MDHDLWAPYDEMGQGFADRAADSAYNAHYDRPAVLAALGEVRGLRVLDAGCGPGLYTAALVRAGADVVGFDASAVMVDLARRRVGGAARIDVARLGDRLPLPDATFDAVVCALVIHYADDEPAAFGEFHRLLRPGGVVVVSTQHPTADWLRKGGSYFDRVLETDVWESPSGRHEVRFWREPLSALCGAATGAGFVIDLVDEPRPAESMRTRYPRTYEKLSCEPGFVLLRLRKLTEPVV